MNWPLSKVFLLRLSVLLLAVSFLWQKNSLTGQDIAQIINGNNAPQEAYPWMVALVEPNITDNWQAQFCGGTLIHPWWVVTAAHCLELESGLFFRQPWEIEVGAEVAKD